MTAQLKVPALVAGMVAGAGWIDDIDLLRHDGMTRFAGMPASLTLGTRLRAFTVGHVRHFDSVWSSVADRADRADRAGREHAVAARRGRRRLRGPDDTMRETHDYAEQGAGYDYHEAKGLNALLPTISTPDRGAGDRPRSTAQRWHWTVRHHGAVASGP